MKPSIPKGTRDFLPEEVFRRNFIFETIREVYLIYGFLPIETPAMENLQTLTGKYGDEGDNLLFKVLNNGDFLKNTPEETWQNRKSAEWIPFISKRGLRYDLTVPFARFVVMHQNDLSFPFKRYQIQPVWRADRPQKGRYQEFWQCDADVVGSDSLLYEAEIIQMLFEAYQKLGIKVIIRINNRKILQGIAEVFGIGERFMDMTIAIDKLDKTGRDGVKKELLDKNISEETCNRILDLVQSSDIEILKKSLKTSHLGSKGLQELENIMGYLEDHPAKKWVEIDITLARGLNYYTGCIFEVVIDKRAYPDYSMGSLSGGGRYDDLTGVFGMPGISGVGISFGADRIYDVMLQLSLFPDTVSQGPKVLFLSMDQISHTYAFRIVTLLRSSKIHCDIYPEPVKIQKQMKYAHSIRVHYVAIIGEKEVSSQAITIKNMVNGSQETVHENELIPYFNRL